MLNTDPIIISYSIGFSVCIPLLQLNWITSESDSALNWITIRAVGHPLLTQFQPCHICEYVPIYESNIAVEEAEALVLICCIFVPQTVIKNTSQGTIHIKMSSNETQGEEAAACICVFRPTQPLQQVIHTDGSYKCYN